MTEGFDRAVTHFGSVKAIALKLGLSFQAVYKWKENGVPVERCKDIENASGGAVTRQELRPDHFN